MAGRKGSEGVRKGEGLALAGRAGPPVPGQHSRNQTVQVVGRGPRNGEAEIAEAQRREGARSGAVDKRR
jgi:hypothetical protein